MQLPRFALCELSYFCLIASSLLALLSCGAETNSSNADTATDLQRNVYAWADRCVFLKIEDKFVEKNDGTYQLTHAPL
jgi:hypothetical protein